MTVPRRRRHPAGAGLHVEACYADGVLVCPRSSGERHLPPAPRALAPGWTQDLSRLELHPPEDEPDQRVPASSWEHRRIVATDDRSGMVIVYAAGGILIVGILLALIQIYAAPRSGPDPTTPQPGASGAIDLRDASAPVPAGTSGGSQSGAPRVASAGNEPAGGAP